MKAQPEDCVPDPRAFERFLEWLDEGTNSNGEKYLEIRRRLVFYFQRKACTRPDELADETLNRVSRRFEEENSIRGTAPAQYCYAIARFVFLEHVRGAERRQVSLDGFLNADQLVSPIASRDALHRTGDVKERLDKCLDSCLQKLTPENRTLIDGYYQGEGQAKIRYRRNLAAKLRMTTNAISIKACRIRAVLEACVRRCSEDE